MTLRTAKDLDARDARRVADARFREQRGAVDRRAFAEDLDAMRKSVAGLVAGPGSAAERAAEAAADAREEMMMRNTTRGGGCGGGGN